ncbi:DUF4328 domain-containing protein [Streptomyces sp. 205]|uniref:DUF4328 domain-containing protein n=2 Tax=Streptomyces coffeae TaxID=621382 RepID=A0ABS1N5Y7_9ACTN|nr:DUF4328 domain-containing protein [Streptomyces coffeae]
MYPCGNCRAVAVGPDGRCAACGTFQQQYQQPQAPGGYPVAPAAGMPAGGVDLRRGLATTLTVLFSLALPALILVLVGRGGQWSVIGDMLDGEMVTQRDLDDADDFFLGTWVIFMLLTLAIAVVWAVWFRKLRLNAEVFAPGGHRFSTGWAAGAWFTPVVNLWFPKQIANDIWRASSPQGPAAANRGLLNAWWVTWIVAMVANGIGNIRYSALRNKVESDNYSPSLSEAKDDVESLHDILAFDMFAAVILMAAAVLALLLVRQITAMQEQRAALPPQVAPMGGPGYGAGGPSPYGVPPQGQPPYGTPQMPPPPPGQPGQQYPPYGHG